MCGLVGFALKQDRKRSLRDMEKLKEQLAWLLVAAQRRGMHATGVAVLTASGDWNVGKAGESAARFVQSEKFQALRLPENTTLILGHTRYATHGSAVDNANNHPLYGPGPQPVIVTHNGVLANHRQVAGALAVKLRAQVDSEVLVRLAELSRTGQGIDTATLALLCGKVRGSIVMAAVDTTQPTQVVLACDKRGDLAVAHHGDRGLLAWGSTEEILDWALPARNGWIIEGHFPEGRIIKIDTTSKQWMAAKQREFAPLPLYREIQHNDATPEATARARAN